MKDRRRFRLYLGTVLLLVPVPGVILATLWIVELHRKGFAAPEAKREARAQTARDSVGVPAPESKSDLVLQAAMKDPESFLRGGSTALGDHVSSDQAFNGAGGVTPQEPVAASAFAATTSAAADLVSPDAALSATVRVAEGFASLRQEAFSELGSPQRTELEGRMHETTKRQLLRPPPPVGGPHRQ